MTRKHYKFNIECSGELFEKIFGKNYLNNVYAENAIVEINGIEFRHHFYGAEVDYYDQGETMVKIDGYLSKAPTEKEILEETIRKLGVELKQAKEKLEKLK